MLEDIKPQGGTELLLQNLGRCLGEEPFRGINLIVNSVDPALIRNDHVNIVWNHHCYDQPAVKNMANKAYVDQVDYFVYVSHWQYEKYRLFFNTPEAKSVVIQNAITPIDLVAKPKKIKLIYTSTPWRGLDVLLDSFALLQRDDVELDVYSSSIVYGYDYYRQNEHLFRDVLDRAKAMKNVNYRFFAPNEDVRRALMQAHIFAYPSTWQETSCLCAIEAAMAGCSVVTTNLGALYETLAQWATYVCSDRDKKALAVKYAEALDKAIDEFWLDSTQEMLADQHRYFRRFWTWEVRSRQWRAFLHRARRGPRN